MSYKRYVEDEGVLDRIRALFDSESDRGSALTAALFLEDRLTKLLFLSSHSHPPTRPACPCCKRGYKPRNMTFHDKIDIASRRGILSNQATADAQTIREIRNRFSHTLMSVTFADPKVAELCCKLSDGGSSAPLALVQPERGRRQLERAYLGVVAEVTGNIFAIYDEERRREFLERQREMREKREQEQDSSDLPR